MFRSTIPIHTFWIFIYLGCAISLELAARDIFVPKISFVTGVLCAIAAVYIFPESFVGFFGDMNNNQNIEYARESMGLLLVAIGQFFSILSLDIGSKNLKTTSQPQIKSLQRADGIPSPLGEKPYPVRMVRP